jgi:SAM-dependent methyltransferase
MTDRERPPQGTSLEDFLGEPPRDVEAWRWLWEEDQAFPIRSHRGPFGSLLVFFKKLFRPLVKVPQNDLWERQRVFNLIVLEHLDRSLPEVDRLLWNAQELKDLSVFLTRFARSGFKEIVDHNDALFSRVDQKLDRYRRESKRLWSTLGATLAAAEAEAGDGDLRTDLRQVRDEQAYIELEDRHRGTEEEIAERFRRYLEFLPEGGEVLDLGCGRGEALAVLGAEGFGARGVDLSSSMVAHCRGRDLSAEQGDLLVAIRDQPEESLDAVISLHVIEHLPPGVVAEMARLAWRALRPGGVLILETPNPLSMVVAARNFWLDPTHLRPVHPEGLRILLDSVGFANIARLDLRPFTDSERLPEISLEGLDGEAKELADRVNRLRDRIDELVFGYQDFGMVGFKPGR